MTRWLGIALLGALLLSSQPVRAPSESDAGPVRGSLETQVWLSESHVITSLSNGKRADVFELGGRLGRVLTDPFGVGPTRGQLEYVIEVIPVIVPFQSAGATYGVGANPLMLKWNFEEHRSFLLYMEGYGGVMRTVEPVPADGTRTNFTTGGGFGAQFLRGDRAWMIALRFHHISDMHILREDPTYNMVQLSVALGTFRHRR